MTSSVDAYLEGLDRLVGRGFEFDGMLSNHGPMAADALVVCDKTDAVVPWVEGYRRLLGEESMPET